MGIDFDDWRSDLLSRVDRGLSYSLSLGAESTEIYMQKVRILKINIQTGMINGTEGGRYGIGCRSIFDKKIGFAATSGITDSSVNFAVESAFKSSKINEKDNRWELFVQDTRSGKEGTLEQSVVDLTSEEAVKKVNSVYKEAKDYDPRISSVDGVLTVSYGGFAVGNSEGVLKSSFSTGVFGYIYLTAVEGNKSKTGFEFVYDRSVPDFRGIGENSAKKAIKLLDSVKFGKTGQMDVVFDNYVSGDFMTVALMNSINGKSIVEGRSVFSDKLNEKVGVDELTIYDDGQLPEDPGMQAIDSEGFPRQTTPVIEKGTLKNFLFDNYYSRIYKATNTGNGSRGNFEGTPSVGLSGVVVKPGSKALSEIISDISDGVLVTDSTLGMGHSNLVTGDFSVVAPACYKIEHGEVTDPIDAVTIAGNFYKSFNQISAIGSDSIFTPSGKTPSLAFKNFTVSG